MSSTQLEALSSHDGVASVDEVLALYDGLPAVELDEMLGEWDGDVVLTGHPGEAQLSKLRWAGKVFRSPGDVDPMICLDEHGDRRPSEVMGSATLQRLEFRGVETATMAYYDHPIRDHFRRLSDDQVLGVMDREGEAEPLVFRLTRR